MQHTVNYLQCRSCRAVTFPWAECVAKGTAEGTAVEAEEDEAVAGRQGERKGEGGRREMRVTSSDSPKKRA